MDNFVIRADDVVSVSDSQGSPVAVVAVQGPRGDKGEKGDPGGFTGVAWFYDDGPPETVLGAKPGDFYVDLLTGDVYKLGD